MMISFRRSLTCTRRRQKIESFMLHSNGSERNKHLALRHYSSSDWATIVFFDTSYSMVKYSSQTNAHYEMDSIGETKISKHSRSSEYQGLEEIGQNADDLRLCLHGKCVTFAQFLTSKRKWIVVEKKCTQHCFIFASLCERFWYLCSLLLSRSLKFFFQLNEVTKTIPRHS